MRFVQGVVRVWVQICENVFIHFKRVNALEANGRPVKIVVSLTSYPSRIKKVSYAIKSLMLQTVRPDRIVLWLSELQFPDKKLPKNLEALVKKGVEVRFTKDDLISHKKYYYALKQQRPDEVVITFDDDLIYDNRTIERLVAVHKDFPKSVVVNRGGYVNAEPDGRINRHGYWRLYHDEGVLQESFNIVPSTGAGCLYPYGVMPTSTFNKKEFGQLARFADDIWIWHNCVRAGVSVVKISKESRTLCEIFGSQKETLREINDVRNGNDVVLRKLSEKYPDIFEKCRIGFSEWNRRERQ